MKSRVVNLGMVKDLLAEWDKVRAYIVAGKTGGFQTVFCDSQGGHETIFMGGLYRDDKNLAARAQLRMSAARMLSEDGPLRMNAK